ncbi:unnamed protein product [Linum tenue]|uniref:Uncharacterized protein n=1 Tax=Linum tenue TaxID=586396 RepID=A0AAV0MLU0_9ROSI|nr:unnamed protein product [Linum tenue]
MASSKTMAAGQSRRMVGVRRCMMMISLVLLVAALFSSKTCMAVRGVPSYHQHLATPAGSTNGKATEQETAEKKRKAVRHDKDDDDDDDDLKGSKFCAHGSLSPPSGHGCGR